MNRNNKEDKKTRERPASQGVPLAQITMEFLHVIEEKYKRENLSAHIVY